MLQKRGRFTINRSTGIITIPADLIKDAQFPLQDGKKIMIQVIPEKRMLIIKWLPDLEHINVTSERVALYDNRLDTELDVYLYPETMFCDHCKKPNCEHIKYILNLTEVQEAYKRKGLKIPESS